jgi:hypothetical protein
MIDYTPTPSPGLSQRMATSLSLKKPELHSPQASSSAAPRPMVIVPPSLPIHPSGPTTAPPTQSPASFSPTSQFTSTSKNLAAVESMLATFASRPSAKVDRLAAVRAAKAAIQGGQQQQQQQSFVSHPLPARPPQAQVIRPTASTDRPMTPMGGSAFGSAGILNPASSGASGGGGGGARK